MIFLVDFRMLKQVSIEKFIFILFSTRRKMNPDGCPPSGFYT
jgi:hypothetical protein